MSAIDIQDVEHRPFTLNSRDDVVKFEALFDKYAEARSQLAPRHFSLTEIYDFLQRKENCQRIFAAILDIHLNFYLLHLDLTNVGATWNTTFSKGRLEGGSILDSQNKFFGKMDIHRYLSSYIFRYRALWDKLMGIFVLLNCPHEYDSFCSANSKKKCFRKLAAKYSFMDEILLTEFINSIQKFDDEFRTPEAHGAGALRRHSLSMSALDKNPSIALIGYWNMINATFAELGKALSNKLRS